MDKTSRTDDLPDDFGKDTMSEALKDIMTRDFTRGRAVGRAELKRELAEAKAALKQAREARKATERLALVNHQRADKEQLAKQKAIADLEEARAECAALRECLRTIGDLPETITCRTVKQYVNAALAAGEPK